jgi:hypothetical protein
MGAGTKQMPDPEIPSSQVVQFRGQGWHFGPKNPSAQDSHRVPLNPLLGHLHTGEFWSQVPELVHGGEQLVWISVISRIEFGGNGRVEVSGAEAHSLKLVLSEDEVTTIEILPKVSKEGGNLIGFFTDAFVLIVEFPWKFTWANNLILDFTTLSRRWIKSMVVVHTKIRVTINTI